MQRKKLLSGISEITSTGTGIVPFLLIMTGSMEDSVFIAFSCAAIFLIVSAVAFIMARWFNSRELVLIIITVSGSICSIVSLMTDNSLSKIAMITLVLSVAHILCVSSDNFNDRVSIEWSCGVAVGFIILSFVIGYLRSILPSEPGFAFIIAGMVVLCSRRIFKGGLI
ncbi:hypothetical protein ACFLTD_03585 [Elusimicrobiota bacterium]